MMAEEVTQDPLRGDTETQAETGAYTKRPSLLRSASLLSAGNMISRLLGLVREMVITYYFGASGQVSAFRVAAQVPTMLYDFLVGGMLSAALVPVLSETLQRRSREDFIRLASVLLSVLTVLLAVLVIALELGAPALARLLAGGLETFDPQLLLLTTRLIRLVAPAVWFFSVAGLITAILYALERFTMPALATAVYNLGIVLCAPLLAPRIGVAALAIGILAGSLVQLGLMLWDLGQSGLRLSFSVNFRHPALRRILWLYMPIAGGLLISVFQIGVDRRLASGTGEQSIAWMANATTLQQLPLGLISVAISLASLPRLSQYYAAGQLTQYRTTLARGLTLLLALILPAALILWILGESVTRLLFERGDFMPADTLQVVRALQIYVIGMLFAAIDFPLNYAFYARNNTLLPALAGVCSVFVYLIVAWGLLDRLGFLGLVWADSAKQMSHAGIMIVLMWVRIGPIGRERMRSVLIAALAALLLGVTMVGAGQLAALNGGLVHSSDMLQLLVVGGLGLLIYGAAHHVLGSDESKTIGETLKPFWNYWRAKRIILTSKVGRR